MRFFLLCVLLALAPVASSAQSLHNGDAPRLNLDSGGNALQGHDPVAYQDSLRAIAGSASYTVSYNGARYRFISAANQARFELEPERFAPAYGGWCAFGLGMAEGQFAGFSPGKYPVDPNVFKILDGRLHVFFNEGGFNALNVWNRDETVLKSRADSLWQSLYPEPSH